MGTPPISLCDTGGECDTRFVTVIVDVFNPSFVLTPPSLRTPPLYFALQNIGEEVNTLRCIVFVFFLTEISRNAAGHGRGEVECFIFF